MKSVFAKFTILLALCGQLSALGFSPTVQEFHIRRTLRKNLCANAQTMLIPPSLLSIALDREVRILLETEEAENLLQLGYRPRVLYRSQVLVKDIIEVAMLVGDPLLVRTLARIRARACDEHVVTTGRELDGSDLMRACSYFRAIYENPEMAIEFAKRYLIALRYKAYDFPQVPPPLLNEATQVRLSISTDANSLDRFRGDYPNFGTFQERKETPSPLPEEPTDLEFYPDRSWRFNRDWMGSCQYGSLPTEIDLLLKMKYVPPEK